MIGPTVTALHDAVDALDLAVDGDELAAVVALRDRLTAKLLGPLRVFDQLELYQSTKAASTKQFLQKQCGLSSRDAGAVLGTAKKLGELPLTEAAFVSGRLSGGQVQAITSVIPPRHLACFAEHEAANLALITPLSVTDTVQVLRHFVNVADAHDDTPEPPERADGLYHAQTLDQRWDLRGEFGTHASAVIAKAIQVAVDDATGAEGKPPTPQQRAGALVDLCQFFLDYRGHTKQAPPPPSRRNLAHLTYLVRAEDLDAGGTLLDAGAVDARTIDCASCTARLLRVVFDANGAIRSYQMLPGTVTDNLFRLLAARDQGCRWPGCHRPAYMTDVHHIKMRSKFGPNATDNCCLFCRYHHHRGAHDKTIHLHLDPNGTLTITYADGTTETSHPPSQTTRLVT